MSDRPLSIACPVPATSADRITLAHGEGGRLMRDLLRRRILPQFDNEFLRAQGDAATLPSFTGRPVLTTDSYVVSPLFFPGGDIGSLAVFGTVNDLAVAGARPLWLSLALIIEEGLTCDTFDAVLESIAVSARRVGVRIVTGDTKVVPRGAADSLYITTTGLGESVDPLPAGPTALQPGDKLLVSGPIGCHGIAVLCARAGLQLDPPPTSDCAPLWDIVVALRAAGITTRAMRDATRGGVAAVLHEWADASRQTLAIEEPSLPVTDSVRGTCELLGIDPLHAAGEGILVAAVPGDQATAALTAIRGVAGFERAAVIGRVCERMLAPVVVRLGWGQDIPLDEPMGAMFPRIC